MFVKNIDFTALSSLQEKERDHPYSSIVLGSQISPALQIFAEPTQNRASAVTDKQLQKFWEPSTFTATRF